MPLARGGAAPPLETRRLTLRAHALSDVADSTSLWGDPVVTRYIGGRPSRPEEVWARVLRYAGHWALLGFGYWVVREKGGGRFVGEVGLADYRRDMEPSLGDTPEAGWVLSPSAHGKGYATEAVRRVLAWGDAHLDALRSTCIIGPENVASIRVAERCGFREVRRGKYGTDETIIFERPRVASEPTPPGG